MAKKFKEPTTTCDNCEKTILTKTAIKEPCGCGCHDYFCDEECQQEYIDTKG